MIQLIAVISMKCKKKKVLVRIVLSLMILWAVIALIPRSKNIKGVNPLISNPPILISHGGGNKEFPDNTLEAFYNSYYIDPNCMMETDVSITKDNVVILSHDTTLDRKTSLINQDIIDINYSYLMENEIDFGYENEVYPNSNGYNTSGKLTKYVNYQNNQVSPLDVNYPSGIFPRHSTVFLATTLEQLIKAFPNNLINVEIKQSGEVGIKALRQTIALMEALDQEYHTFSRIVLASFHDEVFQELKEIQKNNHPELLYSPETNGVIKYFVMQLTMTDLFYRDKVAVLQVPMEQSGIKLATPNFIRTAHRHNIAVHYWTVDDKEDMKYLIRIGADGIMTNIPSLLKTVIEENS